MDLTPIPLGNDTRVNTFTGDSQIIPSVTALADGGFVVTWSSFGQDGSAWGIYGQRYNAAGAAVGTEFRINTFTSSDQLYSSVTALDDGGFVVTWSSLNQDGSVWGVYGQRYNAAGATAGGEFRINTFHTGNQIYSSVTALDDGGFVVTWSSFNQDGSGWGIYGQRYNAAGAGVGAEFRINTFHNGDQIYSSATALDDGGFVVTWSSLNQDGSGWGIYGQRYNAAGAAVGGEFRINTFTSSDQFISSITALNDGGFVVAWWSLGQDGSGWGIYGQRYNAAGAAVGAEFRINTFTNSDQFLPSITALDDGGFVVTWSSFGQDGSDWGIYGQRYDPAGAAVGAEFRVNQITSGTQFAETFFGSETVAQLADGRLVQVWSGFGTEEVFFRLIDVPSSNTPPTITSDGGGPTAAVSVAENTTAVTTVTATDINAGQTLTYSIVPAASGGGADAALFTIDANTGVLSFAAAPNFEAPTDAGSDNVYNVTIEVSDGNGGTDTQAVAVTVTNVNEAGVTAPVDGDAAADAVAENAALGTVVGITASSSDADTSDTVSYALTSNPGGLFAIDASTGVVTVASAIDREVVGPSVAIEVTATSSDGSSQATSFTVMIGDVDEFDVTVPIDNDAAANTVAENAANGTPVAITALASDADATTNGVTYSLSNNAGGRFAIDPMTGVVTVANGLLLDYEAASSHAITVVATSADGSMQSETFTIAVTNVNEAGVTAPVDGDAAADAVAENAALGTVVGITASSSDADTSDTVSYALTSNPGGLFAIDASTGVVTVASAIDREVVGPSVAIEVTATSSDGSSQATSFTVTIGDVDEFDVTVPVDADGAANTVAENAANGTAVGVTALASDADATTNGVTYSLSNNAGGRFAIDPMTGVVTVANGLLLDYEAASSHAITVVATSADGSMQSETFTIAVTNVNEAGVTAPVDGDAAADAVAENAALGTVVGITASSSDADTSDTVSYALTSNPGGLFAIDATTGVVTVASGIDRELVGPSVAIEVTATSSDGSSQATSFTVTIGDVDEFDVTVPVDADGAANTVAENAANGTAVGVTALASDADATTNGVTYSLSNNAGGRFAIDPMTGVVTVANGSLIDYEAASSHAITVVATSADGSMQSETFTIAVTNVNEAGVTAPVDGDAAADAVAENAALGTVVGITASSSDADTSDTVSYALTSNPGGLFAIDATTGVVTVASGIDRELVGSSIAIEVTATSSDGSSQATSFTVTIGDVDEFDVTVPADADGAANTVAENAANGTAVGVTALASDADATTNGVTYSLSNNAGGRFAIDPMTGVVTVANGSLIDYEAASSHAITVVATSADGSMQSETFTIAVTNVNEAGVTAPVDGDATADAVAENAALGTVVGITASSSDADTSDTVSYALTSNPGGLFAIDASTGVVTVASAIDREVVGPSVAIEVTATSSDGSSQATSFTVTIGDVDEFDVTVPVDADGAANTVAENAANGTAVGVTALASDADATTNGVTYSLSNNAGGRFAIDPMTGVVTVANGSLIDYEAASSHAITVVATSADGSMQSETFTIAVTNVNEAGVTAPVDGDAAADAVAENAALGTVVGITASSSDADTSDTVSYALTSNPGGLFAIDASTGVVTVASAIDREVVGASGDIEVTATSSDGSSQATSFTVTIGDVDEFDVTVPVDADGAANTVAENAANGTAVGVTALASDADATTNGVTYSLSNNAGGRFAIDPMTGVVTVANGSLIDYEAASSHAITVVATSADGSTQSETFTIAVTNVNEAITNGNAGGMLNGTSGDDLIDGQGGNDVINAGAGNDTVLGGSGNDLINGGDGNDIITGGSGLDVALGGNGNDTFIASIGDGADGYSGGAGTDTLDMSAMTVASTINLAAGTASSSQSGNDAFSSIENAIGGSGADTITGTGAANVLDGRGGNDTINAGSGNDALIGGQGNDFMNGGAGSDVFVFGVGFGQDTISGFDANPVGGQDLMDISAMGVTASNFAARVAIVDLGAHTLITIDGSDTIMLQGVNGVGANVITQQDFMLSL